IHQTNHWGSRALADHFLRTFGCLGVYELANQIIRSCVICQRVNQKIMRKTTSGGTELAIRPFQSVQIDFTEMPPVQRWNYLLVIVDHLTHWVEAVPTVSATAHTVSKVILEQIIPRHGTMNRIDSDRGTHFTSQVLQQLIQQLGVNWKLHTPWHPQSSGRVERMNQTIKTTLTKLMLETQWSWVKCLPLALLRIRTQPRADLNLSPYEMLFGSPYLATQQEVSAKEHGNCSVQKYVQIIANNLTDLRKRGFLPPSTPLDFKLRNISPGDWVRIKSWNNKALIPSWEGPFQVQLTT
ncbi:TF26 protein, partial [Machaerirhynchus nigripectus]|nr:TF26 protein [Machaerirhynchus nigripectus]